MSRKSFIALFFVLLLTTMLACNLVTQPIEDVKNSAATAESIATSVQGIATALPMETLEALSTTLPDMVSTVMPAVEDMFNPSGEPVSEWRGIPIMPEATAGAEFGGNTYSFKIDANYDDVSKFYVDALPPLGWQSTLALPASDQSMVLMFSKDNSTLTLTAMPATDKNGIVVMLLVMP